MDDGTLCPEQPLPAAFAYAADKVRAGVSKHPRWRTKEPFKSALNRNPQSLSTAGQRGALELMGGIHAGMAPEEFDRSVAAWLARARIPKLNRPYLQCAYQPMTELLDYLRANGFRVFVVARHGADFSRVLMEHLYAIPHDHVLGGTARTKLQARKGRSFLVLRPEFDLLDSRSGRPAAIHRALGLVPIAAIGNSDDDLEVLEWVSSNEGKHLTIVVHHTDGGNEFSYDRKAVFGRLDKTLETARKKGWIIADMTKDWSRVFAKSER
jgi:hypothetical protein